MKASLQGHDLGQVLGRVGGCAVARTQINQVQHIKGILIAKLANASRRAWELEQAKGFHNMWRRYLSGLGVALFQPHARRIFSEPKLQHRLEGPGRALPDPNTQSLHTPHTQGKPLLLTSSYPHLQASTMSVLSAEGVPATAKSRPGAPSFNVKQSSKDQGKDKAPPSRHQWSRMMTMPRPRRGSVRSEPNFQEGEWEVPNGYDYSKPTSGNYAIPAEPSTESCDDELHGSYQAVRASRDFDYHGIYSRERQLFQGKAYPTRTAVLAA